MSDPSIELFIAEFQRLKAENKQLYSACRMYNDWLVRIALAHNGRVEMKTFDNNIELIEYNKSINSGELGVSVGSGYMEISKKL